MKKLIFLILALITSNSWAINTSELRVGDVLLQELHCRACSLIEEQTKSPYSHIAIIIQEEPLLVAEAFYEVRTQTLSEFTSKSQKNSYLKVIRHYDDINTEQLKKTYWQFFHGLAYDSSFLWNNDEMYCSELVWKLLNSQQLSLPMPNPMKFDSSPEQWDKKFKGKTPRGHIGISPASFESSNEFYFIGYL